MEEAKEVDCPICGQKFDSSEIEYHVNKCLNNMAVEKPVTRHQEKKQTTLFSRKRGVKPQNSNTCSKKVKIQKEEEESPSTSSTDANGKTVKEEENYCQPDDNSLQQQPQPQKQQQQPTQKADLSEQQNGHVTDEIKSEDSLAPVKIELTDDVGDEGSESDPINPFFRKRTVKRKKKGNNTVNSSIDLTDSLDEKVSDDMESGVNGNSIKDLDDGSSTNSSNELFTTCLEDSPSPPNINDISNIISTNDNNDSNNESSNESTNDTTIVSNSTKEIGLENFRSPTSFSLKSLIKSKNDIDLKSLTSVTMPMLGSSPEFSLHKSPTNDTSMEKDSLEDESDTVVTDSVTPLKKVPKGNSGANSGPSAPMTTFQQELLAMSQDVHGADVVAPSPVVLSNFRNRNNKNRKDKQMSFTAAVKAVSENKKASPAAEVPSNNNEKRKKTENKDRIVLGKLPLAEQMRPKTLDDYVGQVATSTQTLLKELFHNDRIPSMILWGPPGCGKTSLAHIICQQCKSGSRYRYVSLSATMSGVNDVKEVVKIAKNEKGLRGKHTVLFIDEVHRFNKAQQDSFLPHIEDGTIVLIGATTENPSFHLNNALTSRCRIVVLHQLSTDTIVKILKNAVDKLNGMEEEDEENGATTKSDSKFVLEKGVTQLLADYSNGDARIALTSLDMVLQAKLPPTTTFEDSKTNVTPPLVTCQQIKEELKRCHVKYDRAGDEHYDIISAFHKSIRGGDKDATLYWLARMLEGGEEPLYVARRLIRIASEDIGLADSSALTHAVSAFQACQFIGMPECDVVLAHVATYLCEAPKSVAVYSAYKRAKSLVKECSGGQPGVPLHLRNAPTKLMKELNYGKGYKYTPDFTEEDGKQDYLPKEIVGTSFFT